MSIFDQRNQKVNYQYNAAGNINFGAVQNKMDVISELEKFQTELQKAVQFGALDEEIAIDVESQLKKATIQAKKTEPNQKTILDHLNEAKALLEGITSAAGLIVGLTQAAEIVKRLF